MYGLSLSALPRRWLTSLLNIGIVSIFDCDTGRWGNLLYGASTTFSFIRFLLFVTSGSSPGLIGIDFIM